MKELLSDGKRVIALVPDQFSFAFDKALYSYIGPKDFNKVTVLSFKRLAQTLSETYGSPDGTLLSPAERLVLICLALKKVRADGTLKILSRTAEKPAFAAECSEILDSLRRANLSPDDLKSASEKLGGSLGEKLSDIAEIYSRYDLLLKDRSVRDESSEISSAAKIALKSGYFKGAYVFIDRFDSFSPDEILMIKSALSHAKSVVVNLSMPSGPVNSAVSAFTHCKTTEKLLTNLCASLNMPIRFWDCAVKKTANQTIAGLGDCLYGPFQPILDDGRSVKIYRADTIYEEAELVAATIRRLVTKGGYRLSDIAVITHDLDSYAPALEASFERFGIESFTDRTEPASQMALTMFMTDAIDAAATRKPDTEKILKYLRSPFSPLDISETSALWDYAVRWNVSGDMWLSPFTAGDFSEAESVRIRVIEPLMKLHKASEQRSAKDIATAFCEFLKDINAAERAYSVIGDCADEDMKLEAARLFKQLWSAVMSSVTAIYLTAGEEKMTLRAFSDLLKLILGQCSISSPPQKLECVSVADVERSVIVSPKVAFVVGLADGLFPAEIKKNGLFSGRDIKTLEQAGIVFDISPERRLASERFDCYKALTAPKERLILSWSAQDLRGRDLRPSRFIRRIGEYCSARILPASSIGAEDYCATPASAYYFYAVSRGYPKGVRSAVSEALSATPYGEKLREIGEYSERLHRLSPPVSRKLFAENGVNVTASRIDVYNRCPYEYFCKYGLKIEPVKPLEIDPANRGTVMHFLFESVLKKFGDGFSEISDDDLKAEVKALLESFSEDNLGGGFGKSAKFKADYERLGGAAIEILKNMREEFKVSKFRPERFEFDLSREDGESALTLNLSGGIKLSIRGIVDRVDTFTDPDGKKYIRVVDYKTGEKKFSFDDVYNGINLQLLLYMLALTEGRKAEFGGFIPSGILYMRAGFLECEVDRDPLSPDQKTRLERSFDQLRRNGLIVADDEIISAMDETLSGRFIPVKYTASGKPDSRSQIISAKSFKLLEDFAKNKTIRFGEDLLNGRIDAIPTGHDSEHLQCAYCDYASVCDRKKYLFKIISKADGDELKSLIGEGGQSE